MFQYVFLENNVFSLVNSITVISFLDCFSTKKLKKVPVSYCHFYFIETPFIRINFVLEFCVRPLIFLNSSISSRYLIFLRQTSSSEPGMWPRAALPYTLPRLRLSLPRGKGPGETSDECISHSMFIPHLVTWG